MTRKACELTDEEILVAAQRDAMNAMDWKHSRAIATAATRKALELAANIVDANGDRDADLIERLIRKEIPDA